MIVNTLEPPYYTVIFTFIRTKDDNGYKKIEREYFSY